MRPFVKLSDSDSESQKQSEAFSESDFAAYDLPELEHPRTIYFSERQPSRNGRPGDLWFFTRLDTTEPKMRVLEGGDYILLDDPEDSPKSANLEEN